MERGTPIFRDPIPKATSAVGNLARRSRRFLRVLLAVEARRLCGVVFNWIQSGDVRRNRHAKSKISFDSLISSLSGTDVLCNYLCSIFRYFSSIFSPPMYAHAADAPFVLTRSQCSRIVFIIHLLRRSMASFSHHYGTCFFVFTIASVSSFHFSKCC